MNKLETKIKDNKFMLLIKNRLNYDYVDGKERFTPKLGIPQGGIDSPYLYNIYNHNLDVFVCKTLSKYLYELNKKNKIISKGKAYKPRKKMNYEIRKML